MSDVPPWFENEIRDGMTMLYALSLPSTPSSETIEATCVVWMNVLWSARSRMWDKTQDVPRIRKAFKAIARSVDRWPAPRSLMDNLPRVPERRQLPAPRPTPVQDAANSAEARRIIEEILKVKRTTTDAPLSDEEIEKRRQEQVAAVDAKLKDGEVKS